MNTEHFIHTNRKFKDSLFRKLFGENKSTALSLYNALNNSNYTEEKDLEFTTLDDVIWMKMKNDVSFMVSRTLSLYEHQSTYNPNMPLRGFLYFADLYRQILPDSEKLYGKNLLKIPTPMYYVFYNGESEMKSSDILELKLSDAFEDSSVKSNFEWTATMININYGHNSELMRKCKVLSDYSKFVETVRRFQKDNDLDMAISMAVDECIKLDILSEFLSKHRKEIKDMCLTEFDEEKYKKVVFEDGRMFTIYELVQKGKLTILEGAEELEMSVDDFKKSMVDNGFKIPTLV